jgi:hypothetical protein
MKKVLLAAFLFLGFFSFSQTNTLSWYKTLKGTIDKYPVTMHLHKADHAYSGYYYYDSKQQPAFFFGEDTTVKGKIQLIVPVSDEEGEYFTFTLADSKATGDWKISGYNGPSNKTRPLKFSAAEIKTPLHFTYVFARGTQKLRPKWKQSPQTSYAAASVWPVDKTSTGDFVRAYIKKSLNAEDVPEDIGAVFLKTKKTVFSDYLEANKDLKDDELKATMDYDEEEEDNLMIAFQSPKLLTLAMYVFSYTGGAHGNYGTSFSSIDLVNNRVLVLDDVITESGKAVLSGLLEKNYRKQYHVSPTDSLTEGGLLENKIEPNQNFYVTAKGIGFNYVPYEIASYLMGEINIFIPFEELKEYINPAFAALLD